jgi:hypothetical protein
MFLRKNFNQTKHNMELPEGLPQDPIMLMSLINMKLRDEYPNLDKLCEDMGIDRHVLETVLAQAGFEYSPQANKFW